MLYVHLAAGLPGEREASRRPCMQSDYSLVRGMNVA